MVEIQVKLRCEEQERLGPIQHRISVRHQQRSQPLLRPGQCRPLRAPHSRRRIRHHTRGGSVPAEPESITPSARSTALHPSRTPVDDCHLLTCPTSQVGLSHTTPSSRTGIMAPPREGATSRLSGNSKTRGAVSPREGATSRLSGNSKTRGAVSPRMATARLMRHSRRSKMRRREYKRLRNLLPALQEKQEVSKVEVVAEAARYIDDLHARLLHRLKTRGLPQQLKDLPIGVDEVHLGNIQDMVRHIMTVTNPASLPPSKIENTKTIPSFIAKTTKHKHP